jgi:N-acetylglucosaminyldiphosphoundecaprenol N-acetyl-beta-D-mannosaminyltransferase
MSINYEAMFSRDLWCLMGLPIDVSREPQCVAYLNEKMSEGDGCFLTTPNLNFLIESSLSPDFRRSVLGSDFVIADGMALVWIAKLLDIPLTDRVSGSGVFERLRRGMGGRAFRVFFFGGPEGAGERACDVLNHEDSMLIPCGAYQPGFGSIEDMSSPAIIDRISKTQPDFLLVALGAKKGQAWIEKNKHHFPGVTISHLGAVVNFTAGSVKRAPVWMQNIGMEWIWRMIEEPTMIKRNMRDGPAFLKMIKNQVLPYRRYQKLLAKQKFKFSFMVSFLEEGENNCTISLSGSLSEGVMPQIRQTFVAAAKMQKQLILDMEAVDYIDCSVLAKLQQLEFCQRQEGLSFSIKNLTPMMAQIFKWNNVDYLLAGAVRD